MISQFFILSPRGDTIIMRDYLGNVPKVSLFFSLMISRWLPPFTPCCSCFWLSESTLCNRYVDLIFARPQASSEIFFRKVNFWDKGGRDAPPVFNVDGVSYLYVKVIILRIELRALLYIFSKIVCLTNTEPALHRTEESSLWLPQGKTFLPHLYWSC